MLVYTNFTYNINNIMISDTNSTKYLDITRKNVVKKNSIATNKFKKKEMDCMNSSHTK